MRDGELVVLPIGTMKPEPHTAACNYLNTVKYYLKVLGLLHFEVIQ